MKLDSLKSFEIKNLETVNGGRRVASDKYTITGSGVGTVDISGPGYEACDVSTSGLGWGSGWNGQGNDPYVGLELSIWN